jgi:hypothetical protein
MTNPNTGRSTGIQSAGPRSKSLKMTSGAAFKMSLKSLYLLKKLTRNRLNHRVDPDVCCIRATEKPFLLQKAWKRPFALVQ